MGKKGRVLTRGPFNVPIREWEKILCLKAEDISGIVF